MPYINTPSANPKPDHEAAVRQLVKYLKGTKDKGYVINLKCKWRPELHVDANFSSNWDSTYPEQDRNTARS